MPIFTLYSTDDGAQEIDLQDYAWGRLEIEVVGGTPDGTFSLQSRLDSEATWKPQVFIPLSADGAGDFITEITTFADSAYQIPLRGAGQLRASYSPTTGTLSARVALVKAGY